MRLSRNIIIKLVIVAALLFALYCFEATNGLYKSFNNLSGRQNVNTSEKYPTTVNTINYEIFNNKPFIASKKYMVVDFDDNNSSNYYNVWCIFTKVTTNSPMRRKFRIFTESLLKFATVDVAFHVITDKDSQRIAEGVIKGVSLILKKYMQVINL